jgi:hypothetical protein
MTHSVSTNIKPIANAGPDQTVVDSNNDGSEEVALNGNASSDPDGSIVSYEWREGATVVAMAASPSVWLNVGTHTHLRCRSPTTLASRALTQSS